MKFRIAALLLAAVVIAIGIGAWLGGGGEDKPDGADTTPRVEIAVPPQAAATLPPPAPPVVSTPPAPVEPSPPSAPMTSTGRTPVAKAGGPPGAQSSRPLADQTTEVLADIDNLSLMFRDFRTLMGDNPVGSNAEIMKAVIGGNPKGARLGPPEGQQLNASGELVDAWGTPFFFHQMSATQMDIQSAGPDKIHGTSDDIKGR